MNRLTTPSARTPPPSAGTPPASARTPPASPQTPGASLKAPPRAQPAAIDVHQHIWPPQLVQALRERREPPRLRGWTLELAGEPAQSIDPALHDPEQRAAQNAADGIGLALVSLSSPLGIELLEPGAAAEPLAAWREGALRLGEGFLPWASASLRAPDPDALERDLAGGFVGLQLPACALLTTGDWRQASPLLEALERSGRPLFIHPGPAPASCASQPAWWPALVDYVAQMHAAYFAWRAHGRPAHPRLRVLFALLAGLAPLHGERVAARGPAGERGVVDPAVFLECSSYGTRAIDATVRVLGIDQIVLGSDRPYAAAPEPRLGEAAHAAIRHANPIRLLGSEVIERCMTKTASAKAANALSGATFQSVT
ncbi:MAG TPA: hypothetical protein VKV27_07885 [Solirubrobacteraceae bacterium]|nr:hypothetical protein [Solirubrobacteraceae bacterium]